MQCIRTVTTYSFSRPLFIPSLSLSLSSIPILVLVLSCSLSLVHIAWFTGWFSLVQRKDDDFPRYLSLSLFLSWFTSLSSFHFICDTVPKESSWKAVFTRERVESYRVQQEQVRPTERGRSEHAYKCTGKEATGERERDQNLQRLYYYCYC